MILYPCPWQGLDIWVAIGAEGRARVPDGIGTRWVRVPNATQAEHVRALRSPGLCRPVSEPSQGTVQAPLPAPLS